MRYRVLIALTGLALLALLVAKPELRRELQSTFLSQGSGPDGGAAATESMAPLTEDISSVVVPGSFLTFELMGAPRSHYLGAIDEDAGDQEFRVLIAKLASNGAQYDPWLSRAARELAYQGALFGDSPPEEALSFILRSSGSPELSVAQVVVRAKGEDPKVISDAIARALVNAPSGPGDLLVGVGEAATDEERFDRRVVVVVARRNFQLEPTRRSVEPNKEWEIRGRGPSDLHDAHASVLYPDLTVVEIPLAVQAGRFTLRVPTGSELGALRVSIDGQGEQGPFKLLQLEAEVGLAPPREFEVLVPETEEFADLQAAETHAFLLLNEDRRRLALPPLVLDLDLSAIARMHSIEMRDRNYFAHLSPTSGLAGDRLKQARYRASAHGENLALNDSVYEAQASLLQSVGHRRNIINTSMTHVGIGLAREESVSGEDSWYLTQLFARKTMPFDAQEASEVFLGRINSARRESGAPPVVAEEDLDALAAQACQRALTAPAEEVPNWLAPKASRLAGGSVAVSVNVFYEFDDLVPGETTQGEASARIGLCFLRDEEDMHGKTILVVIAAE